MNRGAVSRRASSNRSKSSMKGPKGSSVLKKEKGGKATTQIQGCEALDVIILRKNETLLLCRIC